MKIFKRIIFLWKNGLLKKVCLSFFTGVLIGFLLTSTFFHKAGTMKWIYKSGSLLQWISAIGTLVAVFSTIYFYHKDHQKRLIILQQLSTSFLPEWEISAINTSNVTIWVALAGFQIISSTDESLLLPPKSPKCSKFERLESGESSQTYSLEMEEITKNLSDSQSTDDRISIIIIYKDLGGKTYNRIFTASKKNLEQSIQFSKNTSGH
jgi:hypothetical protein